MNETLVSIGTSASKSQSDTSEDFVPERKQAKVGAKGKKAKAVAAE